MAKIGILLTLGPYQFENWETAYHIANAALEMKHDVLIFYYLDGVYNPIRYQKFPDMETLPKDCWADILKKGGKIIACGICVNARGLENGKDYIDQVKVGGLPDFAEIIGEVDRIITL